MFRIKIQQINAMSKILARSAFQEAADSTINLLHQHQIDMQPAEIRSAYQNLANELDKDDPVNLPERIWLVLKAMFNPRSLIIEGVLAGGLAVAVKSIGIVVQSLGLERFGLKRLVGDIVNDLVASGLLLVLAKNIESEQASFEILRERMSNKAKAVARSCPVDLNFLVELCPDDVGFPPVLFDAHMHIQSANCTTMPTTRQILIDRSFPWVDTVFDILQPSRTLISSLMPLIGDFGELTRLATDRIGEILVSQNNELNYLCPGACDDFLGISVVLTMDMEYAQINGYKGVPIYQYDSTRNKYFYTRIVWKEDKEYLELERQDVNDKGTGAPNIKQEEFSLSFEEKFYMKKEKDLQEKNEKDRDYSVFDKHSGAYLYETWNQQLRRTESVAIRNPLRLLPMYHYDPRRLVKLEKKKWDEPFRKIASYEQKGLYLGFKMYTPLGYMPADKTPEVCEVLENFYGRCEREGIPIMNHCGPAGAYTHERDAYLAYARLGKSGTQEEKEEDGSSTITVGEYSYSLAYDLPKHILPNDIIDGQYYVYPEELAWLKTMRRHEALRYFKEQFIHPAAWESVVEKYPKLRLCLAHFGTVDDLWADDVSPLDKKATALPHMGTADFIRLVEKFTKEIVETNLSLGRERISGDRQEFMTAFDKLCSREYSAYRRPSIDSEGTIMAKSWIVSLVELCSKENNVYTDISFLPLLDEVYRREPGHRDSKLCGARDSKLCKVPVWRVLAYIIKQQAKMKNKIMFGTDWPYVINGNRFVSKGETKGEQRSYVGYFNDALRGVIQMGAYLRGNNDYDEEAQYYHDDCLREEDKQEGLALFHQFAIINPLRFYRLVDIPGETKAVTPQVVKWLEEAIERVKDDERTNLLYDLKRRQHAMEWANRCMDTMVERVEKKNRPLYFGRLPTAPASHDLPKDEPEYLDTEAPSKIQGTYDP